MTSFAIIGGTGALGAALAGRLAGAGHEVWVGSRDPAKAQAFAAERGGGLRGAGLAEAAANGEIVVLAVPYAAHAETLAQIRDAAQGKIVVDTTVPLRPPKVGTVQLPAAGCAASMTDRSRTLPRFATLGLCLISSCRRPFEVRENQNRWRDCHLPRLWAQQDSNL